MDKKISKLGYGDYGKLCIPQVRKSSLLAFKKSQNLKIKAGNNQKLRSIGQSCKNFKNIAELNLSTVSGILGGNDLRLQARLQVLLRLTLQNLTKSKCKSIQDQNIK
jgi:hypothetical protein